MPMFNVRCPTCGDLDDVFASGSRRVASGCTKDETLCSCGGKARIRWHGAPVAVSAFSTPKDVPGLGRGFQTWKEIERAADKKGKRIVEGSEMKVHREAAREDSASYAKDLGVGSRQEYAEARKKGGTEMVRRAKERKMERAVRKYGGSIRQEADSGGKG